MHASSSGRGRGGRLAAALPLLLLGSACGAGEPAPPPRPDIVLIVVDTLRSDRLGCYGHDRDTSPNLDALARDGVLYAHAQSQAPWTTPSVGSMLTSQYPSYLGIDVEGVGLTREVVTFPEVLDAAGYKTGAIVANKFCSSEWNFDQGFDFFDETYALGPDAITSADVTRAAVRFLDEQVDDEPFFLWVHYFDPHFSYYEHDRHRFPGGEGYRGPMRAGMEFDEYMSQRPFLKENPEHVEELVRLYDSEIAFTDAQVGVLLDHLSALGRYDDALILFTSDHGEEFMDHGNLAHSKSLFRELTEVPLIVKYPDGRRGTHEAPVALLDIYPTLLDAIGAPPRPELVGRSLLDDEVGDRSIFSETSRYRRLRSVVSGDYKLIHNVRSEKWRLFHRVEDPTERKNIVDEQPEVFEALRRELVAWMEAHAEPQVTATQVEISDEERAALRALGYLGAEGEEAGGGE